MSYKFKDYRNFPYSATALKQSFYLSNISSFEGKTVDELDVFNEPPRFSSFLWFTGFEAEYNFFEDAYSPLVQSCGIADEVEQCGSQS